MKRKKGFNIRTICGENIIVAEGKENIDFSNVISMNSTSAYLWNNLKENTDYTPEDLANMLAEEYEVEYETALSDCNTVIAQWIKAGIAEE